MGWVYLKKITVHNPKGVKNNQQAEKAKRITGASGLKIAFVDNLKPQADQVMNGIREQFAKQGIETTGFSKTDNPTPVPVAIVQTIKENYHGMVTGVGD
jgi:hypothetical protein